MRGQHFGFLVTLCTVWIAARVGFLSILPLPVVAPAMAKSASKQILPTIDGERVIMAETTRIGLDLLSQKQVLSVASALPIKNETLAPAAFAFFEQLHEADAPAASARVALPIFQPSAPPNPYARNDRFSAYAYSFIRRSAGSAGLAAGNQYGGSQSGFIATYTVDRDSALMLLARGAIAHDRPDERELAAGIRWQPLSRIPASVTIERRFRHDRGDAFAAYVSGGKSQAPLPLRFKLDAFTQAGVVSGKNGGAFFDASARAARPLVDVGKVIIVAGGGVWGGGQSSVFRIDAGPTIGAEIPVGKTRLRLDADWRFRIAGDASPANGPALTLSTSF